MKKGIIVVILAIIIVLAILLFVIPDKNSNQQTEQTLTEEQQNNIETPPETIEEATKTQEHTVEMTDFKFVPQNLNISAGDTVTWVNKGKGKHYVLSTGKRVLDSKNVEPGESWSFTFEEQGNYHYFSPIYQSMIGTVKVN